MQVVHLSQKKKVKKSNPIQLKPHCHLKHIISSKSVSYTFVAERNFNLLLQEVKACVILMEDCLSPVVLMDGCTFLLKTKKGGYTHG